MANRTDFHRATAQGFLARSGGYLADGDLLQASEKGWGAAAHVVKAAAERRGWRHQSHRDLFEIVNRLAEETSDDELRDLFREANALHRNFYSGTMTHSQVRQALGVVDELILRVSPLSE